MWKVKRRCTCEKKRMINKTKGRKYECISKCCRSVCVSKHKRTQLRHHPLNHNWGHLSIWLVCSLNNGANMKRVTEKIWSSDGGHGVPALRAEQGINSSHEGITRGSHLHLTLTTKVEQLVLAPVQIITIHIGYAFNFLYANYGGLDLHGFV